MQNTMDSRRFRLSRYLPARFEDPYSELPTVPDSDCPDADEEHHVLEEPTQVWSGREPRAAREQAQTNVAVPRPVQATYDDDAHPDLRLYDAVGNEPTEVVSTRDAFRQLGLVRKPVAVSPNASFADETVPDAIGRSMLFSHELQLETVDFRSRISFSTPTFVLFVVLCLGAGALLGWAYTEQLAPVGLLAATVSGAG
jgi:hypothetical protein